jgi:hypothetical protein
MIELLNLVTTKLWFWYARKVMKWNWMMVTKNKEQTEIISLAFCDKTEIGIVLQEAMDKFIKEKGI